MIFIDRLLVSGVRFVLDKVATAANSELNDAKGLREALLDAQMRLELGEIGEDEFAELESVIMERLREVRERELERASAPGVGIAGVEITLDESVDEHRDER